MNRHLQSQIRLNHSTSGDWEVYAGHRGKLTGLILACATRQPRLCVLGAGNCNDLDLGRLLDACAEVHLVDLDAEALAHGVAWQGVAEEPSLHLHGDVDVTACLDGMAAWSPASVLTDADLDRCVSEPAGTVAPPLSGPFDLVVSDCLLSQLIGAVVDSLGEGHPRFVEAVQAVRLGHLRLLTDLTVLEGSAILCTDVVASDTVAGLASVAPGKLKARLAELIEQKNFFHGLNPAVLQSVLRSDPVLRSQIAEINFAAPWLWHLTARCYAVYALRWTKRSSAGALTH